MFEARVVYSCQHDVFEKYNESISKLIKFHEFNKLNDNPIFSDERQQQIWEETYFGRDILFSPADLGEKLGLVSIEGLEILDAVKNADSQPDGAKILSVESRVYEQGIDYDIVSVTNGIEGDVRGQYIYIDWRRDGKHPDYYSAEIYYVRTFNMQYAKEECPKCCGDGWYVGLFERASRNASSIEDENKLVQAFFKFIHTRRTDDSYGSTIYELPGRFSTTEYQTLFALVRNEIDKFETYYKNHLSSLILKGYPVSDYEKLQTQNVVDMDVDEDDRCLRVQVRFITMAGTATNVNIILPEEE